MMSMLRLVTVMLCGSNARGLRGRLRRNHETKVVPALLVRELRHLEAGIMEAAGDGVHLKIEPRVTSAVLWRVVLQGEGSPEQGRAGGP